MRENEVLEFIVVPPYHRRNEFAASEGSFVDFLKRRFRGYSFKIAGVAPIGGDDEGFHIFPVMNFVDDSGAMRMCEPVQPWFVREIEEACVEYATDKRRSLAS
ncbi:hypothetical protein [Agrobacterium larrymoorei]|uniref:Uncharacterized protein n=1 Tax=Agrobacterium larrymoorei TaxID=160699 RepID=A0ABU0UF31_9HYPH|nr:hypothetical protein [Agrobacterium larrymoorei]MDQ1183557.1 hypothetical protein [Agrobacterium larrymoorei]